MTDRPTMLEGLRVLDCSRVIAGPYAAMLMGDLGADVIKLERPGRGDDFRALRGDGAMSAAFAAVNRNKRGIAVDLAHPDGRRVAFELARRADVLIENFLPGVAERQGLGYAAVSAANPGIVYASVTGFGQDGPLARRPGLQPHRPGHEPASWRSPASPAIRPPAPAARSPTSPRRILTFGMVQAALVHRARAGRGQHLDVNLLASTIGDAARIPSRSTSTPASGPGREGNRNPNLTPAEAYRTGDGYLNVVLLSPDQWERFCGVLGDEVLRTDPRFATNPERLAHHAEMKARVGDGARGRVDRRVGGALREGADRGGPIYEFDEVFEDPQVRHLGVVAEMEQPGYGTVRMVDFPVRASATPARISRPAPLLGRAHRRGAGRARPRRGEIERLAALGAIALGKQP